MLFSSKTLLGLALAINTASASSSGSIDTNSIDIDTELVSTFDSNDVHPERTSQKRNKKNKKSKKTRKPRTKKPTSGPAPHLAGLEYRIVSQESDLYFIPAKKLLFSVNKPPPPQEVFSLPGSQFLQNGNVYDAKDVDVNYEDEIACELPEASLGVYNQQCTAVEGTSGEDGSLRVLQNICHYNLCFVGNDHGPKGCLFLRSGGFFDLDPFDQTADAVPTATAIILGGTGSFRHATGLVTIETLSVPANNPDGESVLELVFF